MGDFLFFISCFFLPFSSFLSFVWSSRLLQLHPSTSSFNGIWTWTEIVPEPAQFNTVNMNQLFCRGDTALLCSCKKDKYSNVWAEPRFRTFISSRLDERFSLTLLEQRLKVWPSGWSLHSEVFQTSRMSRVQLSGTNVLKSRSHQISWNREMMLINNHMSRKQGDTWQQQQMAFFFSWSVYMRVWRGNLLQLENKIILNP